MKYRHPGYQKPKHLSTIGRTVSVDSKESQWICEVMEVIDEVFPRASCTLILLNWYICQVGESELLSFTESCMRIYHFILKYM